MTLKKWMGGTPTNCDLCHKPLEDKFIDGRTKYGPWAIMCVKCHKSNGSPLGPGNGQMYDLKTLEKVGG